MDSNPGFPLAGDDQHDPFWLTAEQSHQDAAPMDIDFEFDSLSWTDELDLDVNFDLDEPSNQQVFDSVPVDFLFSEDESALSGLVRHEHMSDTHMHDAMMPVMVHDVQWHAPPVEDPTPERLRNQLSLLSEGSCGDELVFKNCDSSKAMLLHGLSIEFGLNYSHDTSTGDVSIARATTGAMVPFQQATPSLMITSPFQGISFPAEAMATESVPPIVSDGNDRLARRSSRSQRISDSISKHVSTWKTSMSKGGGRRGPLTEDGRRDMKVLEGAGGACWRCKVLRRKCDAGSPCRCCLQSVPMPHLGDDAPLWPLIGCRRGPLRDALPLQVLCPAVRREAKMEEDDYMPRRSLDLADRCLLSSESQRLADMKAVLECASYKLSISDPSARQSFVGWIEAGRYRNNASLQKALIVEDESVTYTEMIATIAWELAENHGALALLEMRSWEEFINLLETASIYESEVGQTSLVMLSMICLRHCLQALRLYSAGLLLESEHIDCKPGLCQVQCIQDLSYYVERYISELSAVVFNKENMRDRRWWLSTFYSLCIQSYVRHALIAIEKQLCFETQDDVPSEDLTGMQYLHLAAVLFTAASAKYDPLLGGRLQYALTENSVIPETSVPELHHASARSACEVEKWPEIGIKTSYQFLRKLLQIGSLDFEQEQHDVQPIRTSISSGRLTPETLRPSTGSRSVKTATMVKLDVSPVVSATEQTELVEDVTSPKKASGNKRWSAETGLSLWSATSVSNASSLSLARTFLSDVTSIHEVMSIHEVASIHEVDETEVDGSAEAGADSAAVSGSTCLVCYCCPRAPQRFRTGEELTKHEAEKPYPCSRCKRRFKSPAEADRHTKAVHIKSHYWACKAMESPMTAFHQETYEDGTYDICGLCGGGFLRADTDQTGELVSHLEGVHHYGECNRDKEFYRVDNFRQHLKTTHVAKQGRWLKELEGRCRMNTTVN